MFPIGDDDSRLRRPGYVNYALIALNVLVFGYQVSLGSESSALQDFILRWGVVPEKIIAGNNLLSLITSMFLHGGWAHLIGNMAFLWVFGNNIEDALGHVGYLIFYLLTGLAASAVHIWLSAGTANASIPSVGASGAISGVLGAYIVLFGTNRIRVLIGYFVTMLPAWMMIGLWAGQQILATYATIANTDQTTMGGGVAYGAHAGGFLAGVVAAFALRGMVRNRQPVAARRLR
jgi:membrane associated rhomboid family serine protease